MHATTHLYHRISDGFRCESRSSSGVFIWDCLQSDVLSISGSRYNFSIDLWTAFEFVYSSIQSPVNDRCWFGLVVKLLLLRFLVKCCITKTHRSRVKLFVIDFVLINSCIVFSYQGPTIYAGVVGIKVPRN